MSVVLAILGAACEAGGTGGGELWGHAREAAPVLVRSIALPVVFEAGATLSAENGGRLWLGSRDTLRAVDSATGALQFAVPLDALAVPRVLGLGNERVYVQLGDELLTLDETGEVRARRTALGGGVVLLDPLERHVYHATETGAVFGLHPRLLRPVWAWPRLGAAATALASSPEGDRLYLALAPEEPGTEARLLERDVQTGRVLTELAMPATVQDLRATSEGTLVALLGDGAAVEVLLVRPGPSGLAPAWRQRFEEPGPTHAVQLRIGAGSDRVAVFALGPRGWLRVLDAQSGATVGEAFPGPLDADFGAHSMLFLLDATEVRVLQ